MKKFRKYSDLDLIALIASNKEPEKSSAFSEIYNRYSRKIYLYCRKIFGEGTILEDIYQDAFLQFLKSIENGVQINNIKAYLLTIVRNLSLNYKRSKKVETVEFDDLRYFFNDKTFEMKELSELIDSALDLLPEDYLEAFVLQTYYGLSYKEISELIDVPLSTVRNRVVRAKLKLRDILAPILDE